MVANGARQPGPQTAAKSLKTHARGDAALDRRLPCVPNVALLEACLAVIRQRALNGTAFVLDRTKTTMDRAAT